MLEELDDFREFVFGFFAAGDVFECDAGFLFGDEASAALAEAENGFPRAAHAAADENPDEDHDADRQQPGNHELGEEAGAFAAKGNTRRFEVGNEVFVFDADRPEVDGFLSRLGLVVVFRDLSRVGGDGMGVGGFYDRVSAVFGRIRGGCGTESAFDGGFFDDTFGDPTFPEALFEFAVRYGFVGELGNGALPEP